MCHVSAGAGVCIECETNFASKSCKECEDEYCLDCFSDRHAKGKKVHSSLILFAVLSYPLLLSPLFSFLTLSYLCSSLSPSLPSSILFSLSPSHIISSPLFRRVTSSTGSVKMSWKARHRSVTNATSYKAPSSVAGAGSTSVKDASSSDTQTIHVTRNHRPAR